MAKTNESAEVSATERVSNKSGFRRAVAVVLPAWVMTLGVDLFLHAGLMAGFYNRQIPFLVSPEVAFRRIPAGYFSFLLLIIALYWLLKRMDIRGSVTGFRWGIVAGLTLGGATLLGLWSIATAPIDLLVSWWIGQGLELGIAGAVLGAARQGTSLLWLWGMVGIAIVILIGLTIALQIAGFGGF